MANTWQQWVTVLKNAYGSVPPLLQSPIGKFANWIRENYGKDVVGFESSKTLSQLPDIKLDKSGKLDLSTIDWKALKQSISQAPPEYQALFDQLTKSNLALPAYSDSVRDFLNSKKLPNGEPLEISYDNKTRTVLVNGKTFLTPDQFIIGKDQRAMSNSDILDKAYTDYLASNFQVAIPEPPTTTTTETPTVPTTETTLPDFSKMTPTELTDWITGKGYEGELDYYTKTLDMLNQKDNAMTQRINDLWDPYIKSATDSLDAAYNVQKSALESQTGGIKSNAAANIADIERAIMSSRARTKEDMNARGLLFSGLLTRALSEVEATGVSEKAKVYAQETSDLNKIAAQIAVLTANLPIEKNNLSQQLTFQKGLQLFNLLSANDVEKDKVNLAMAQTETNIKNLKETAGARGEIATREEQAALADAKAKADQQNFENSLKLAGIQLSYDQLTEKVNEFNITSGLSQGRLELDTWYRQQQIDLQTAAHNLNVSKFNADQQKAIQDAVVDITKTPLSDILKMTPSQLTTFITKLEGFKQQPLDATGFPDVTKPKSFPEGFEAAEKMEGLALSLMNLSLVSGNLDIAENMTQFQTSVKAIAPSLSADDVGFIVDNYITDPLAKVYAYILFSAQGDTTKLPDIYYKDTKYINDWMDSLGLNAKDKQKFYELIRVNEVPNVYGGR